MKTYRILLFALLCAFSSDFAFGQAITYRPKVGELHPEFVLPRIDNRQPLALSDYRGSKVLLLHFASW